MSKTAKPGDALLRVGVIGTVVAALCCFTPVLVVLFGTVGLAAVVGYLDLLLYPALGLFVLLTLYALWRRQRHMKNPEGRSRTAGPAIASRKILVMRRLS